MNETKILAAMCRSRECYDTLLNEVGEAELGVEGVMVLDHVAKFYAVDPEARAVDMDILTDSVLRGLASPKHRDLFGIIMKNIGQVDTSALNVVHEVLQTKRRACANHLAVALTTDDASNVERLMEEYARLQVATTLEKEIHEYYHQYPVADLISNEANDDNRIKFLPLSLNNRLRGGGKRGHNALIIARPEVGKTGFAVNLARGFLSQGLKVLYLGNEDPIAEILMRVVSSISGMTEDQIKADPERAQSRAMAGGYDNLIMQGLEPGTMSEVAALARAHTPDVLMLDQARHVKTGDESKVQSLEAVAVGMRVLAKRNNLLSVMISQAGETAANKLNVVMEDLADNKTGMQGAVDLFLGIGCNDDFRVAGRRRIQISKNKIGHVNDWFDVNVVEQLSRYE